MEPASVSLTFDDGLRCQFARGVQILDRYRLPATFFLIANEEATHESWSDQRIQPSPPKIQWNASDIAMLQQLIRNGHEIGSHSVTHNLNLMRNQPEVEAVESKRFIEERTGRPVSSFGYPYYRSHEYLASAVKNAGYEQARGGAHASFYVSGAPMDRFNVDCRQILPNESVRSWMRPGCWHVLTLHAIGGPEDGWGHISVEEFERQMGELAKLRNSGLVKVVTFADGAARQRSSN